MIPPPPRPTLFPYTTLFRSGLCVLRAQVLLEATRQHQHNVGLLPYACRLLEAAQHGREIPVELVAVLVELRCHDQRSEEHTSELQSRENLVCRLLLEKKKNE